MEYSHVLTETERTHLTYLTGYVSGSLHEILQSKHAEPHIKEAVRTLVRLAGLQEEWLAKMADAEEVNGG